MAENGFFSESDGAARRRADADLGKLDVSTPLTIQQQIALCCRVLAREQHALSLAGQITVKGEKPGQYWTTSIDVGFSASTPDTILLIDENMNVIEGAGRPNPAIRFHFWVYAVRPDLNLDCPR